MIRVSSTAIIFTTITLMARMSKAGLTEEVKYDPKCTGATLHDIRVTDCTKFPCIIVRGKDYTVDAEFSIAKYVKNPVVRCGTIYLGRQHNLPGHGGCETITNGTCPLSPDVVYNTVTSFNIPYYVPPILYTLSCQLEDDDGKCMLGGVGSGRVV